MKTLMSLGDSMTPSTRPITTKKPVTYLIMRILVIIGLLMFFSSESMAAQPPAMDQCGMFPSVLTAQNNIEQSAGITCSLSDPGNVNNDITVINTTTINASNQPTNTSGCAIMAPPPVITLPTFLDSNVSGEEFISVDRTITDQDVKSLKIDSNSITVTFTASQPYYSDSSINVMKIGTVDDQNRQWITYVFNEGDYWIKNWNTNGNNVVIQINGHVRLFIGNNFKADTNNLQVNVAPNSGVPSNLYVYGYNDIIFSSSGSANYDVKGYFYAAHNFVANGSSQNQDFTGAIRAGHNISLGANQHFYYDSSGAGGSAENCTPPNYNLTGLFDAWNSFRSVSDRNISTEIVNKDFNLTIASLNATNTALQAKPSGVKARYRLIDTNTSAYKTPEQIFDANLSSFIISPNFNASSASRNVKVEFKYCADYNGTHFLLKADALCSAVCSSQTLVTDGSHPCFRKTYSTDAFAIRPDRFEFTVPGLKKAGEDYSITTYAKDYNSAANAQEYNQSVSSLTGAPKSWWDRDTNTLITTVNTQGTTTIAGAGNFTNGLGDVPIRFSDVGKFTLDLNDTNWAAVDIDDSTLSDRTIHGEGNVTFIPWNFNISAGTIVNDNGTSPSFTYLSNDLNMSAKIPMSVSAQNKQGGVTQNYADNMYERNITITPYVASTAATTRGLTPLTLGVTNADANFTAGSKAIVYNDTLAARFNFSRDPRVAVSPFDVSSSSGIGNDVNVSIVDTDSVYGDKNLTLGGNATFVYGRIIPRDVRIFGANTPFTANAWYEVFNTPTIAGASLTGSRNDSSWFINRFHSDVPALYNGDANVTYIGSALQAPAFGGLVGTDGIEDYNVAAGMAIGGYKAHIGTDSWLWYGVNALPYANPSAVNSECSTHPCFNINVVPTIGATGSAKTSNEGERTSRSSTMSGGWRSTSDYAPSVQ